MFGFRGIDHGNCESFVWRQQRCPPRRALSVRRHPFRLSGSGLQHLARSRTTPSLPPLPSSLLVRGGSVPGRGSSSVPWFALVPRLSGSLDPTAVAVCTVAFAPTVALPLRLCTSPATLCTRSLLAFLTPPPFPVFFPSLPTPVLLMSAKGVPVSFEDAGVGTVIVSADRSSIAFAPAGAPAMSPSKPIGEYHPSPEAAARFLSWLREQSQPLLKRVTDENEVLARAAGADAGRDAAKDALTASAPEIDARIREVAMQAARLAVDQGRAEALDLRSQVATLTARLAAAEAAASGATGSARAARTAHARTASGSRKRSRSGGRVSIAAGASALASGGSSSGSGSSGDDELDAAIAQAHQAELLRLRGATTATTRAPRSGSSVHLHDPEVLMQGKSLFRVWRSLGVGHDLAADTALRNTWNTVVLLKLKDPFRSAAGELFKTALEVASDPAVSSPVQHRIADQVEFYVAMARKGRRFARKLAAFRKTEKTPLEVRRDWRYVETSILREDAAGVDVGDVAEDHAADPVNPSPEEVADGALAGAAVMAPTGNGNPRRGGRGGGRRGGRRGGRG